MFPVLLTVGHCQDSPQDHSPDGEIVGCQFSPYHRFGDHGSGRSRYSPREGSPLRPVSFLLLYLCPQPLVPDEHTEGRVGAGRGDPRGTGAHLAVRPPARLLTRTSPSPATALLQQCHRSSENLENGSGLPAGHTMVWRSVDLRGGSASRLGASFRHLCLTSSSPK